MELTFISDTTNTSTNNTSSNGDRVVLTENGFGASNTSANETFINELVNLQPVELMKFLTKANFSTEVKTHILNQLAFREANEPLSTPTWYSLAKVAQARDSRFPKGLLSTSHILPVAEQVYRYRLEFLNQQINGQRLVDSMTSEEFYSFMIHIEEKVFSNINTNAQTLEQIVHEGYLAVYQEIIRYNQQIKIEQKARVESERIRVLSRLQTYANKEVQIVHKSATIAFEESTRVENVTVLNEVERQNLSHEVLEDDDEIDTVEELKIEKIANNIFNLKEYFSFIHKGYKHLIKFAITAVFVVPATSIVGPIGLAIAPITLGILYPRKTIDYSLKLLAILGTFGDRYFFRDLEYRMHEIFGTKYSKYSQRRDDMKLDEELRANLALLRKRI